MVLIVHMINIRLTTNVIKNAENAFIIFPGIDQEEQTGAGRYQGKYPNHRTFTYHIIYILFMLVKKNGRT